MKEGQIISTELQIGNSLAVSVPDALTHLRALNQEQQWKIVRHEVNKAADTICTGKPVSFYLIENTKAGGIHGVKALYMPSSARAFIEVPEEPEVRGGRFPSVLHTAEIIAATARLAHKKEPKPIPGETIVYQKDETIYPTIEFIRPGSFNLLQELDTPHETSLVPLTVDPSKTNAVIIHTQARHIDPRKLASEYYEIMKNDPDLPNDLLRHTILYNPQLWEDQLPSKHHVAVGTLPKELAQNRFKLAQTVRIASWDWNQPDTNSSRLVLQHRELAKTS